MTPDDEKDLHRSLDNGQRADGLMQKKRRRVKKRRSSSSSSAPSVEIDESNDEDDWGDQKVRTKESMGLFISAIILVAVLLAGAILGVKFMGDRGQSGGETPAVGAAMDFSEFQNDDIADDPAVMGDSDGGESFASLPKNVDPMTVEWFDARAGILPKTMAGILEEIGDGTNRETFAKHVRGGRETWFLAKGKESIFEPAPVLDRLTEWGLAVEDQAKRASATFSGKRRDGSPFAFVFVAEDGVLKLDWEASAGYNATTIAELIERRPAGTYEVRGYLRRGLVYLDGFKESDWQCWEVGAPEDIDGSNSLWVYAPRDSALNKECISLLNDGGLLLDYIEERQCRFLVEAAGNGKFNRVFRLLEVVDIGWAKP